MLFLSAFLFLSFLAATLVNGQQGTALETMNDVGRYMIMFSHSNKDKKGAIADLKKELLAQLKKSVGSKLTVERITDPYLSQYIPSKDNGIYSFEAVCRFPKGTPMTPKKFAALVEKKGKIQLKVLTPRTYRVRVNVVKKGKVIPFETSLEARNRLKVELETIVNAKFDANYDGPGDLKYVIVDKSWSWCQFYNKDMQHTIEFMTIMYSREVLSRADAETMFSLHHPLTKFTMENRVISWHYVGDAEDPDLYCRNYFHALIDLEQGADPETAIWAVVDGASKTFKYDSNAYVVDATNHHVSKNQVSTYLKVVCKIAHKKGSSMQKQWDRRSGVFIQWPSGVKKVTFGEPKTTSILHHEL